MGGEWFGDEVVGVAGHSVEGERKKGEGERETVEEGLRIRRNVI